MEASSEIFVGSYFCHGPDPAQAQFSSIDTNNNFNNNNNHFTVDDLLDFSNEDETMTDAFLESLTGNSADSSTVTAVDSCNSSVSGGETTQFNGDLSCRSFTDAQFSDTEFCVPYDDLAELEWLSNFVEESFSSDDMQFIPTAKPPPTTTPAVANDVSSSSSLINTKATQNSPPIFPSDVSVPGKARSKRSRAAPCDWSSRILVLSPTTSSSENTDPSSTNPIITSNNSSMSAKTMSCKRREYSDVTGRKCLHCGSEKTPQWRTGPMGPKTLCNACGVRYKSGRLVPEYRPASSPTFVSAKHSNSHRKVIELRRQKELQRHHAAATQHMLCQNQVFGVSNGADDYLIHHQQRPDGPDFRHMI